MAQFKRNHNIGKQAKSTLLRYVGFTIGVIVIIGVLYINSKNYSKPNIDTTYKIPSSAESGERYFLPSGSNGELVNHQYYTLSYSEKDEQAEWVAYELTKKSLQAKNVKRAKRFNPDYDVSTRSAFHRDYSGSGYTRGHMAPAGDMAFNEVAMQESFYMSNMSPQSREFNNGIWRELESQVRDWAYDNGRVFVVTGPMLNRKKLKNIGKNNKVTVPSGFYKVIIDIDEPDRKGIAFVIPHAKSDKHLQEYAISIDQLEDELGWDFFADLISTELQEKIESTYDLDDWEFDEKRYLDRVEHWNNQ